MDLDLLNCGNKRLRLKVIWMLCGLSPLSGVRESIWSLEVMIIPSSSGMWNCHVYPLPVRDQGESRIIDR
jgi:hypothetical protein